MLRLVNGRCPACGRDYSAETEKLAYCTSDDCPGMQNRYYKFQCEGLTSAAANQVNRLIEKDNAAIVHATSTFLVLTVKGNGTGHSVANKVRDEIWKRNRGLLCEYLEVTEDDVMDYI